MGIDGRTVMPFWLKSCEECPLLVCLGPRLSEPQWLNCSRGLRPYARVLPLVRSRTLCLELDVIFKNDFQYLEMDPTNDELAKINTPAQALAWFGMEPEVWDALKDAMGPIKFLRELVLIPQRAWDEALQAVRIKGTGEGASD